MKQPSLSHLKIDRVATKKIRTALSNKSRVADSLTALQTLSNKRGIPYHRLEHGTHERHHVAGIDPDSFRST